MAKYFGQHQESDQVLQWPSTSGSTRKALREGPTSEFSSPDGCGTTPIKSSEKTATISISLEKDSTLLISSTPATIFQNLEKEIGSLGQTSIQFVDKFSDGENSEVCEFLSLPVFLPL
jgi:hypothetical protein